MSTDAMKSFESAWRLHERGQWQQAEQIYHDLLEANPRFAPALYGLGLLRFDRGNFSGAVESLQQAIAAGGNTANYYASLAQAYAAAGQLNEALGGYRKALELKPDFAAAHNNLGNLYRQLSMPREAAACYERALAIDSQLAEAHNNLAVVRQRLGQHHIALEDLHRALAIKPDYADANYNLGTTLQSLGRLDESIAAFREALRLQPNSGLMLCGLAGALRQQGSHPEAIQCYEAAAQDEKVRAAALDNLGQLFQESGDHGRAIACYRKAIRALPAHAAAYGNLGNVLVELGAIEQAEECYDKCVELFPTSPEAHYHRGLLLLAQSRLTEGWPEYQWIASTARFKAPTFPRPKWDGQPLNGKTLLVHSEHGLGDTLFFIRYLKLLRPLGGKLVVCVQPPLVPMLRCSGFDVVSNAEPLPRFDMHISLLQLPVIFGTKLDTIPANVPYLHPDRELVEAWREEIRGLPGLKVGIHWQGARHYVQDRDRSIPLYEFLPLADLPGASFVSLQKNAGVEQLAEVSKRMAICDLGLRLDEAHGAFMDTAAVMQHLDVLITSDSAVAHLAGGLGINVWLVLNLAPDWRWLLKRSDSPWYPTMRIFRQRKRGDWPETFRRVAAALGELVS